MIFIVLLITFCHLAPSWSSIDYFVASLQRFTEVNKKDSCHSNRNSYCPTKIIELINDERKNRAVVVKPFLESCRPRERTSGPGDLQNTIKSTIFPHFGDDTHSTIHACLNSPTSADLEVTGKFYYYTARLNAGAKKIAQDRMIISHLLGTQEPPCPQQEVLEFAYKACEQLKKCTEKKTLDQITYDALNDENAFNSIQAEIQDLPKTCKNDADCAQKEKDLTNASIGLMEKNPWLLDGDFRNSKSTIGIKKRLENYFKQSEKNLATLQKQIEQTATCVHGGTHCDIDEMRETLFTMPPLPIPQNLDSHSQAAWNEFETQRCIEEKTHEKNSDGSTAKGVYFEMATLPIAFLKLKHLNSLVKVGKLSKTDARAFNVLLDAYNSYQMGDEVVNSCVRKDFSFDFKELKDSEICTKSSSNLSPSIKQHGDCLLQASTGGAAAVILTIAGYKAFKTPSPNSNKNIGSPSSPPPSSSSVTSSHHRVADDGPKLKTIQWVNKALPMDKVEPLHTPSIPQPPPGIEFVKSTNSEGKEVLHYITKEKLPNSNQYLRVPREFQLDPLTGAIAATYSSGKDVLGKLVESMGGRGHLAFIDVGSLRLVDKTFKAPKAGDDYLKAVTAKILEKGEGKITLARTGGDEFALLINETNPEKVRQLLSNIRDSLRRDREGGARQVFSEEKKRISDQFKNEIKSADAKDLELIRVNLNSQEPISPELLSKYPSLQTVKDFHRIQPDISIGSAQIGAADTFETLAVKAEEQAQKMKIDTALAMGRDARKYGVKTPPKSLPNPLYRAEVESPSLSNSWDRLNTRYDQPIDKDLSVVTLNRSKTLSNVGSSSIGQYTDQLGRTSYRLEKRSATSKDVVTYEIPTKGSSGILDGTHPESKKYILNHFNNDANELLFMPKLSNLGEVNYFVSGTTSGDKMLDVVSQAIKKETRDTDLSFKLNGADFIMSLKRTSPAELIKIQNRIVDEVKKNPEVKKLIQSERNLLTSKLSEARRTGNQEAIQELKGKIDKLKNFSPKLEFQSLSHSEMKNTSDFDEVIAKFDQKFDAARKSNIGK